MPESGNEEACQICRKALTSLRLRNEYIAHRTHEKEAHVLIISIVLNNGGFKLCT